MNQDLKILSGYFVASFLATIFVWHLFCPVVILSQIFSLFFLLILSWTFGWWFFETFTQETVAAADKLVLITGCDPGGFGHYLAAKLDFLGFNVYAGMLTPDGEHAENLQKSCSERLKIVRLDVTKPEDVAEVLEQIQQNGSPLWAVINTAGQQLIPAPFDWGKDVDQYRQLFDSNVFGSVRLIKKCIPLLRRSKGRIVNMTSVAGRSLAGFRWQAAYAMSQHSVRVFSDVIRRELSDSGIKVITVDHHAVYGPELTTDSYRKQFFDETPVEIQDNYGGELYLEYLKRNSQPDGADNDLDMVVDAMLDGVMKLHPKPHYRCCSYWEVIKFWALANVPDILLVPLERAM